MIQKLMPVLKKTIEQKQEFGARAVQMKISKKIDSGLSDQYKQDDYNINKLQDSQLNNKANLDEIKTLYIA